MYNKVIRLSLTIVLSSYFVASAAQQESTSQTVTFYSSPIKHTSFTLPDIDRNSSFELCNIRKYRGKNFTPLNDPIEIKKIKTFLKHQTDGEYAFFIPKNLGFSFSCSICKKGSPSEQLTTTYFINGTSSVDHKKREIYASARKNKYYKLHDLRDSNEQYVLDTNGLTTTQPLEIKEYKSPFLIIPKGFKGEEKNSVVHIFIENKETGERLQPAAYTMTIHSA